MNLDDVTQFERMDPQDMLGQIQALPEQLLKAWELGERYDLPHAEMPRAVLLAGMGGSAIGADLLAAYAAPVAKVPLVVWRNYEIPAWARGPETLVVASSHSGNTEETLSSYDEARRGGARLLVLTTGGELARRAQADGIPLWRFEHKGQPRAAVGYSFGLLLAAVTRLGIIPDPSGELRQTVEAMKAQQERLTANVPATSNQAKRIAGQFVGRMPVVLGSGMLGPVARRWRTQIGEISKALGQFEELPEADHNMLAGVDNPQELVTQMMILFLRSSLDHPRNLLRVEATCQALMVEGFCTDVVDAIGDSRMAHQWTALHYGDYVSYYLAMAYGADPTPVAAIEGLKRKLAAADN